LEAKPLDGSIRLRPAERKAALHALRRGTDPDLRLRAHTLLLLDAGQPWALIVAVLFTRTGTINRWRKRSRCPTRRLLSPPLSGRTSTQKPAVGAKS
jgi:hypothetical protein